MCSLKEENMPFDFDVIIGPFLVVLMFFWIVFSLFLIFRPFDWINMQNRRSKAYGFEIKIIDESKFVSTRKRSGILLLIFGVIFIIILVAGLIII